MTSERSWTHRAAQVFYEWLVVREDLELPRLHDICPQLEPLVDPYRLATAIQWLAKQGMIDVRHGTRSHHRGHYVIRVRSTGRIYRTVACPFDLPENDNAGRNGLPASRGRMCDDSTQAPAVDSGGDLDLGQDQHTSAVGQGASPLRRAGSRPSGSA